MTEAQEIQNKIAELIKRRNGYLDAGNEGMATFTRQQIATYERSLDRLQDVNDTH